MAELVFFTGKGERFWPGSRWDCWDGPNHYAGHIGIAIRGENERPDPLAEPEGYGVRPGQQPQQAGPEHDTTCDTRTPGGRCGRPRDWVATIGCVNEHIGTVDLCDPHKLLTVGQAWGCTRCRDRGHAETLAVVHLKNVHTGEVTDMRAQRAARVQDLLDPYFKGDDHD